MLSDVEGVVSQCVYSVLCDSAAAVCQLRVCSSEYCNRSNSRSTSTALR
jgi:hypothetical protein